MANLLTWDDAKIERLRQLVGEGLSAAEVAEEFSVIYKANVTRNAIVGKCHRANIPLAHTKEKRARGAQKVVAQKIAASASIAKLTQKQIEQRDKRYLAGKAKKKPMGRILEIKRPVAVEKPNDHLRLVVPKTAIDLIDLENCHCRFPYGKEPPFKYCGDPTADLVGGRPYCAAHQTIVYRKPTAALKEAAE